MYFFSNIMEVIWNFIYLFFFSDCRILSHHPCLWILLFPIFFFPSPYTKYWPGMLFLLENSELQELKRQIIALYAALLKIYLFVWKEENLWAEGWVYTNTFRYVIWSISEMIIWPENLFPQLQQKLAFFCSKVSKWERSQEPISWECEFGIMSPLSRTTTLMGWNESLSQ